MSFEENYSEFQTLADKARAPSPVDSKPAAPNRNEGESASAYSLRVAVEHYSPHHWKNDSAVFNDFTAARKKGRAVLSEYMPQAESLSDTQRAELSNIYIFVAPLDAINWTRMKNIDRQIKTWEDVVSLNSDADDITFEFYKLMAKSPADYPSTYSDIFPSVN